MCISVAITAICGVASESFIVMTSSFSVSGAKFAVMDDFRRASDRLLEAEINSFTVIVDSISITASSSDRVEGMGAADVGSLCTGSNWRFESNVFMSRRAGDRKYETYSRLRGNGTTFTVWSGVTSANGSFFGR